MSISNLSHGTRTSYFMFQGRSLLTTAQIQNFFVLVLLCLVQKFQVTTPPGESVSDTSKFDTLTVDYIG